MKKKAYSPEQVVKLLRGVDAAVAAGETVEEADSESFNSRLRDELLNREVFGSPAEAEVILAEYRRADNHDRPHSSLGYVAPAVFASRLPPAATA